LGYSVVLALRARGDETLKTIAREIVETVRNNATIAWTVRFLFKMHL
jgi:hypothetical protein